MTDPGRDPRAVDADTSRERLIRFLTLRLTEELGQLWAREAARRADGSPRSGLAAHVEVVDSVLRRLASGRLPDRNDLAVLHTAYRDHPDFDPEWLILTGF